MVVYAVLFATAALCSAVLSPVLTRVGHRMGLVDLPGDRRVHQAPIPRLGGVAVVLSLALAFGLWVLLQAQALAPASPDPKSLLPIMAGAALVFAIGLWDDVAPITPALKLAVQFVAALIVMSAGITIGRVTVAGSTYALGAFAAPVTMGWILVVTNAFNLMDGLDGLAAGLAAIAAATCTIVLIARGEQASAMLLVSLAGAIVGFLAYNFHPAKIFLGDSGSLLAGFLLAVTAITGHQKGATTLAAGVPLLIFAVPIADTCLSIVRRLITGQRQGGAGLVAHARGLAEVFKADRSHIHHRLLDSGLSHTGTVLVLYALALVFSALALVTMQVPGVGTAP